MTDFQEQLANLRRRIAKIDQKYAKPVFPKLAPKPPAPSPESPEDHPWQEVETTHGRHFETESYTNGIAATEASALRIWKTCRTTCCMPFQTARSRMYRYPNGVSWIPKQPAWREVPAPMRF